MQFVRFTRTHLTSVSSNLAQGVRASTYILGGDHIVSLSGSLTSLRAVALAHYTSLSLRNYARAVCEDRATRFVP